MTPSPANRLDAEPPTSVVELPPGVGFDGSLTRVSPLEGVAQLIAGLAGTPRGFWPHAEWFGAGDLLADGRPDEVDVRLALASALEAMGLAWVRITSLERLGGLDAGTRGFLVVLESRYERMEVRLHA